MFPLQRDDDHDEDNPVPSSPTHCSLCHCCCCLCCYAPDGLYPIVLYVCLCRENYPFIYSMTFRTNKTFHEHHRFRIGSSTTLLNGGHKKGGRTKRQNSSKGLSTHYNDVRRLGNGIGLGVSARPFGQQSQSGDNEEVLKCCLMLVEDTYVSNIHIILFHHPHTRAR